MERVGKKRLRKEMRLEKESMNVREKTNMLKLEIKRKNMQIRTTAAICYGKNNMANGGNH